MDFREAHFILPKQPTAVFWSMRDGHLRKRQSSAAAQALVVMALLMKYRKRVRTSNSIERLNQEIRRRERAIRILPNQASAFRLIGALLLEQNEECTEGRKYPDMEEYREWMESQGSSEGQMNPVPEGLMNLHTNSGLTEKPCITINEYGIILEEA